MCYRTSQESLLSFGISTITKLLRKEGYSLNSLESILKPDSGDRVDLPLSWTRRNSWTGEREKAGEIKVYIRKDSSGLYMELQYTLSFADGKKNPVSLRYDLIKRESNLKPGTYRYYFRDPSSQEESLCSKLYLLPELGEFVPRSVLSSWGVLYSQQRRGKKDRYFSGFTHAPSGDKLRYRKRHYRGKETPFWRRYRELSEREEYRWGLYLLGNTWNPSICPPEIAEDFLQEYHRASGRKYSTFKLKNYR